MNRSILFAAVFAVVMVHHVPAQNLDWDGGGLDTNWSNSLNWVDDVTPLNNGTETVWILGASPASLISTVDVPFDIKHLRFNTSSSFTLGGAAITLRGDAAMSHDSDRLVFNEGSALQTIDADLILEKGGAINGLLVINGDIAANGSALRFTSGNVTVNGVISSLTSGDTVAVNSGATVSFNAANTFTKGMTVWNGTAKVGVDSLTGVAGAFGMAAASVNMGHQGSAWATILTTNAVTIGRNIDFNVSRNTGFSYYTLGGESAHVSNYTGNILLGKQTSTNVDGVPQANTAPNAFRLTAAAGGRVNFYGNLGRATTATGSNDNMRKEGAGVVAVHGATNDWEGETQVTAGTFYVNGTMQAATSGKGVVVSTGAKLGGNGTVNRQVSLAAGGILEAGDEVMDQGLGRYTIGVAGGLGLTLNATGDSVLSLQVAHASDVNVANPNANMNGDGTINWTSVLGASLDAGLNNDTLVVQGDLVENVSGLTTINLSAVGGGAFAGGMVWDLMDWSSVNGVANAALTQSRYQLVVDGALQSELTALGLSLDTSRFWDTGYVGLVPEPERAMLMLMALSAWGLRRVRNA